MSYKYINEEKFKNNRVTTSKGSGIVLAIMGVAFWFLGIYMAVEDNDKGFLIIMGIIGLSFILTGLYLWHHPKAMEKKLRELDDPNSQSYKKKQEDLEKKKQKYLAKAESHKSLRFILCIRKAVIYGICLLVCLVLTVAFILAGRTPIILFIADFLFGFAFFYAFTGRQHRKIMERFSEHGLGRDEAESDFAGSRAYIVTNELMSVSSRFFLSSSEGIVLSLSDIVWVFSSYENIDHYSRRGIYTYTSRRYHLNFGLENGTVIKAQCPEELCPVITDDVVKNGISVTSGYSEELEALYKNDPEHFRNALKPAENIIYTPVGPEFKA